jgi:hypothetical protein
MRAILEKPTLVLALLLLTATAAHAVKTPEGGNQGTTPTACQTSCRSDDFKCCARLKFLELQPIFARFDNFWVLGHSFDTVLDYFTYVDPSAAPGFAPVALDRYDSTVAAGNCWYDDGSWWAIAALKASQFGLFDAFDSGRFLGIAESLWRPIQHHAPNVWANATPEWSALEPRFSGGVWNYFWTKEKNASICNTPCPGVGLCGIQNTVTNGLYLILASRMFLKSQDPGAQQSAADEYEFFDQWFRTEPTSLLNRPATGGAVVRERVGVYASGAAADGYDPALAWAGDQGLVLGGLVDQMTISGSGPVYEDQLQYAKEIAVGAQGYLSTGGALQPWKPSPPANDPCDYATGPGVFMRNVLHAHQTNADLKAFLQISGYPAFVRQNARLVFEGKQYRLTSSCWGVPSGAMPQVINLTNDLATLVAAAAFDSSSGFPDSR